jgi:7,8-dihydropterin-6-yl-methyl-4-(beta-D-ribofuranosyl)aminobenzene 5'-phosphate synthase
VSTSVTILADNCVERGEDLLAEHGFSVLLDAEGEKVLLDAGQTGVCVSNARRLNVGLDGLAAAVLSHGHYDHGGGVPVLLDAGSPLELIVHPEAFAAKYARSPGREERYVGLAYDAESLAGKGANVRLVSQVVQISRHVLSSGPIPYQTDFEKPAAHFWVKSDGEWQPDWFRDEQAVVAATDEGLVVVVGCAHVGVINALRHAIKLTGRDRIRALVGGLHLAGASPERIENTVVSLQEMGVDTVVACHCTGFAAQARLHAAFGDRFLRGGVGLRLTI